MKKVVNVVFYKFYSAQEEIKERKQAVVFYDDGNTTKIVALTEINKYGTSTTTTLGAPYWANSSDYDWIAGATIATEEDETIALNDMNGRYNTTQILNYISANNKTAEAATATNLYAPSVCGTGSMCAKGNWYLPAAGELWSTCQNYNIINILFVIN